MLDVAVRWYWCLWSIQLLGTNLRDFSFFPHLMNAFAFYFQLVPSKILSPDFPGSHGSSFSINMLVVVVVVVVVWIVKVCFLFVTLRMCVCVCLFAYDTCE